MSSLYKNIAIAATTARAAPVAGIVMPAPAVTGTMVEPLLEGQPAPPGQAGEGGWIGHPGPEQGATGVTGQPEPVQGVEDCTGTG